MSKDNGFQPPPTNFPAWQVESQARAEEENWDREGKLRGQEERNHLLWLRVYGAVPVVFLAFFTLLFLGAVFSWTWHYLSPASHHWLTDPQLSKIQSILFSGSIGGVVSFMAQKQISK